MDSDTNIQKLKDLAGDFRDERDWKQFHNPKDLSEAISIEAGELLELFLWQSKEDIAKKIEQNPEYLGKIKKELADVFITSMNFANNLNLDISEIIEEKIKENKEKYPVEKAKGVATKYNEL